jgi:hypothetical protein
MSALMAYFLVLLLGGKGDKSDKYWHLMRLEFDSWQGQEIFFSSKMSRSALGPNQLLFSGYKRLFP